MVEHPQRAAALVLAAALACGCDDRAVVELAGVSYDYAFAVFLRSDGAPSSVSPVLGAGAGLERRLELALPPEERRFALLLFDDAELRRAVPHFDPGRAVELALEIATPPHRAEVDTELRGAPSRTRHRLPGPTRVLLGEVQAGLREASGLEPLTLADSGLAEALTLVAPVALAPCDLPGQSPLVTFASEPAPLAALEAQRGLRLYTQQVLWIDDERALVVGTWMLAVVTRGASVAPSERLILSVEDPASRGYVHISRAHIAPMAPGASRREILFVGGWPGTAEHEAYGKVWRAWLGPEGLTFDGALLELPDVFLLGVAMTPDGREAVVVGAGGRAFRRAHPEAEIVEDGRIGGGLAANRVTHTGDLERPFLAATRGTLHHWDARSRAWSVGTQLASNLLGGPESLTIYGLSAHRSAAGEIEAWAVGTGGMMARLQGITREWAFVRELAYPTAFGPCGSTQGTGGPVELARSLSDVTLDDTHVFIAPSDCSAVLQVRRSDLCTSLIAPEGEAPQFSARGMKAVDVRPGALVALTAGGEVMISTWPSGGR